jgi:hypothetical protein
VEATGIEPANLLRARQTLYQLSYTPKNKKPDNAIIHHRAHSVK